MSVSDRAADPLPLRAVNWIWYVPAVPEAGVPASTPVRNISLEPRFSELSFLHVAAWGFDAAGLPAAARWLQEWGGATAVERLNLDGLLALWHPPTSE